MRPSPPRRAAPWSLVAVLLTTACSEHAPIAPAEATPEKQFIFEGVRVDEHDQNGRSWVGTARRASGDLSRADAEGIRIRHYPEDTGGRPVDILAPRGRLEFEDQEATLDSVRILTPDEGVITGGIAHYHGKESRVLVDGPIGLDARGMVATATSAVVSLDRSAIDVDGPVVGQYRESANGSRRPHAATPSPAPAGAPAARAP